MGNVLFLSCCIEAAGATECGCCYPYDMGGVAGMAVGLSLRRKTSRGED